MALQTVFTSYLERAVHFMELPGEIPNRQVHSYLLRAMLLLSMPEGDKCITIHDFWPTLFILCLYCSELYFYIKQRRALHFAWLSGAGIYHGGLIFGAQQR